MMSTMSKSSILATIAAGLALMALPTYLRTAQLASAPLADAHQEDAVTLRIMFGVQRIHPKTWDGEIALSRGSVVRLTGVFFEQKDAIVGKAGWTLTSRATT